MVASSQEGRGEVDPAGQNDAGRTAEVTSFPLVDGQSSEAGALTAVIRRLSAARTIGEVMAVTTRAARALVAADGVTFVLRDGDLCYYADEDAVGPLWKGERFPMSACISGWVMQHGAAVVIPDIEQDDRIPQEAYRPTFVRSLAMVPIRQEDPIGAMGAYWAEKHTAGPDELERLQTIANAAALAIAFVERCETEAALRDRASMLDALLDYVPEGITIARGPDATIERVSAEGLKRIQRAEHDLTGIGAEQHPGAWQVFDRAGATLLSPDELPLTRAVKQAETVENERLSLKLPDGRLLPILCNAGPIRDAAGNVTGGIVAWRDISDLVKLEEERELLVHELSHRVKNLFAVMSSMVKLTASGTDDVREMAQALTGRINALARAHDLIRPAGDLSSGSGGTNLADLFDQLLAPRLDRGGPRCEVSGPNLAIGAAAATKLAMVIHELATNAAKYGALSASSGTLRVDWQEKDGSLLLQWAETGGPPTAGEPGESGFGGKLIEATVRQLGGEVGYAWNAAGLQVTLCFPVQSLQE